MVSGMNTGTSPPGDTMAEKITAVKHCNNEDIWIIAHGYGPIKGNKFYAYLISSTGLNTTPVVSTVGTIHDGADQGGRGNARGYMKAAPNGSKIALAICFDGCPLVSSANTCTTGSFELFDFDYTTGIVSNPINLFIILSFSFVE